MAKPKQVGVIWEIDPSVIDHFPDQPRKHFGLVALQNLGNSMKTDGQKDPIIVCAAYGKRNKGIEYFLVDGERRWKSAKEVKILLKAIVISVKDAKEHYLASATANFHREPHTEMEIAKVVQRFLTEYDMKWPEIVRRLGIGEQTLKKYLELLDLPYELQQKFQPNTPRDQRLPISVASELSRLPKEEQLSLVPRIKGKRADEAREIIRRSYTEVEARGGEVKRAARGRDRRPSDDIELVTTRIARIIADMKFLTEQIAPERLRKALAGRNLGNNVGLVSELGDICTGAATLRTKVRAAMPDDVKQRLPK
ncbi:MAG: ParB/RepB/Spo0J family partition protein [Candidatus Vogelbacteria bacterium]|nr:ParB/RepB/Spo0J family partition protein [Candidatus Vogelbacteria bacterium]